MPDFNIELSYIKKVIGLDEVGRGPLAGPVVACAFIFLDKTINPKNLNFINDSKKLSLSKRNQAMKSIINLKQENKIKYSLGIASVEEIDNYNILEATKLSMERAIIKLNEPFSQLIIDGNIDLCLKNYTCESIIKGDQKSITIATASIIAKIHRDRLMSILSNKYKKFKWEQNSGYGTKYHLEILKNYGPTVYHRKSFEPIKSLIHNK